MDPAFPRAFGAALKELREERGMTQEELDFASHIHRTTISNWERGVNLPTFEYLLTLCEALDCQPSELLARAERQLKRSRRRPLAPRLGRPPNRR